MKIGRVKRLCTLCSATELRQLSALTLKVDVWKTRTYRQYVLSDVFLLMCSGDERNILKVFVAGREIDLAPPVRPPSPGILECHFVVHFEMLLH